MLSDTKLRALKPQEKPYRITDEKGLYVQVSTTGSRLFRFKYKFDGKEKLLAFGQYPDVTLARARELRDEARRAIAEGIDPSEKKKNANKDLFGTVFNEWYNLRRDSLADGTASSIMKRTTVHVLPYIGNMPVTEITSKLILDIARRIEDQDLGETAKRSVRIIGQVMRYAIATGRCQNDPTPALRGALKPVSVQHYSAIIDKKELANFLRVTRLYPNLLIRHAIQLQVMLFVRPGELRQAEWAEIDLDAGLWKIPAEKMKLRVAHVVPLATQAIRILRELQPLTGQGRFVFPSHRTPQRPLSENGVNVALRSLGFDNGTVTGHGFRATARTLLVEELRFNVDVVEMQLAHAVRDPLGRAYNRTTFIDDRIRMMQAWADWLDGLVEPV